MSTYGEWTLTDACTINFKTFINRTEQFDEIIPINRSRLEFQRLIPDMNNVESLRIEPAISAELSEAIKTVIKSGTITDRFKILLPYLRASIAYYTYADYFRSGTLLLSKHLLLADAYLDRVMKILYANPDLYPEFVASDSYKPTDVGGTLYENTEENSIFVFNG